MIIQKIKTNILVTGSTGLLGKKVCQILSAQHTPFVQTTRSATDYEHERYFDLKTGEASPKLLEGIKTVLHLASDKDNPDNDIWGTDALIELIKQANQQIKLVYISIVGTDEVSLSYFRQKAQTEKLIKESGIPFTILRATQFYEFVTEMLDRLAFFPFLAIIPKGIRVQPMDANAAASMLVKLLSEPATNSISNIGGNQIYSFGELAERWYKHKHERRLIINWQFLGISGDVLRNGILTTTTTTSENTETTWSQWLENLPDKHCIM